MDLSVNCFMVRLFHKKDKILELSKPDVSKNFQKYFDFVLHKSS